MVLAELINLIFTAIYFLVLARILMSWLPMIGVRIDPYNPIVRFLIDTTDVFLEPFRRLIPPIANIDFSPIIALLVLDLVRQLVVGALVG
ncbi:MAG: YggT family protein [Chloroflexota bacterium]|nr:YggT family protein [Chloroflexota bacterium]